MEGYKYAKWQFFIKEQINAQIGMILYAKKRFDEALPYLKSAFQKNWMAMAMLATIYYKDKQYDLMKSTLEKAIKNSPKRVFVHSIRLLSSIYQ